MRIGICDDDKLWREKAQKIIEEYAVKSHLPMQIFLFVSGEDVLKYDGAPLDVLFCDIELENAEEESAPEKEDHVMKENGITLAKKSESEMAALSNCIFNKLFVLRNRSLSYQTCIFCIERAI